MYTILGFKKNSGKLDNGKEWSNFTLHCAKTSNDNSFTGEEVQVIKCPTKLLQENFENSSNLVGAKVNFIFDMRTYNGQSKVVVTGLDIID